MLTIWKQLDLCVNCQESWDRVKTLQVCSFQKKRVALGGDDLTSFKQNIWVFTRTGAFPVAISKQLDFDCSLQTLSALFLSMNHRLRKCRCSEFPPLHRWYGGQVFRQCCALTDFSGQVLKSLKKKKEHVFCKWKGQSCALVKFSQEPSKLQAALSFLATSC